MIPNGVALTILLHVTTTQLVDMNHVMELNPPLNAKNLANHNIKKPILKINGMQKLFIQSLQMFKRFKLKL